MPSLTESAKAAGEDLASRVVPNGVSKDTVIPLWINGKEHSGASTFDVISPHSVSACWQSARADKKVTLEAIEAAQAAFPSWKESKPTTRSAILIKAAQIFEDRVGEYAKIMETEMGAEPQLSNLVANLAIGQLRDIAGRVSTICGTVPIAHAEGSSCIVYKEPYGVILGICAWNAPFVFGVRAAATAIATGNTAIIKASELSPRCYWVIGKIFADAGLPAGVLNVITTPPSDAAEVTETLIEHAAIRKVNFTGSANIGRKIAASCGKNLKPCLMELGGKNSSIVLADADLEKAVRECLIGSFINSGQICMATDRLILHKDIAPAFLQGLKQALASQASSGGGPPRVISAASRSRLQKLVSTAVSNGAEVVFPEGSPNSNPADGEGGTIFIPTVLGNVREDTELWTDEAFGPVVAYRTVENEDEAVRLANDTEYGLSAAVFTRDLRKGLAIAKRLESGAVHINSMSVHDEPALPFGGVKNSGWGRFNASAGLEEFLVTKSVTWDD